MDETFSDYDELFRRGAWPELDSRLDARAARCSDDSAGQWRFVHLRALMYAAQGRYERCIDEVETLEAWGNRHARPSVKVAAGHVRALLALSLGHPDLALVWATACGAGLTPEHLDYALLDLVEAAVRAGADSVVDTLRAAAAPAPVSPHLRLRRSIADALVEGVERHRDLLASPDVDRWPFEAARLRLAYGEQLRRSGSILRAREHLAAASRTFRALGADPWRERCDGELRASGLGVRRHTSFDLATLTAQERRIAELAASGCTNREIGQQLYLSPRTVATHLYHAFPKLGIATRAALRDALSRADQLVG